MSSQPNRIHGVQMLRRLIYRSRSLQSFCQLDLQDIVSVARRNNRRSGLGGALFDLSPDFVEVLEGDPDTVEATFQRIRRDWRHQEVTLVDSSPIRSRAFSGWTMLHIDQSAIRLALARLGRDQLDPVGRSCSASELLQICLDGAAIGARRAA